VDEMKRILLVDADSKDGFANLALMKLSAWLKGDGHTVDLIKGIPTAPPLIPYDEHYISTIYFQNRNKVEAYARQLPKLPYIGGSGWNESGNELPSKIEHIMPDYDLYSLNYSMGFTSRGCIRKCPWCVVPKKEGTIKDHAPVSEFLDSRHDKLILLDNNFQASPKWKENLQYIIDNKIRVNINQGLDARLITPLFAEMLSASKCYDWKFRTKGAHLAFDTMNVEKPLVKALTIFNEYGMPPKRFVIYILAGFNTTYDQDVYRVNRVIDLGAVPYIMKFNRSKDPNLSHLARWVNRKYYQWVSFDEYKGGVLLA
jgi:hypothetical protein